MKVRIPLLIEVDPDDYDAEYGEHFTLADIASDMTQRVKDTIDYDLNRFAFYRGVSQETV